MKNTRKTDDFCTSWEARIARGGSWVARRTSWGGLGPLLGALGPFLGALEPLLMDLGSLLGDLESVLGDLDSILGCSWGLLARSWVVLGVQESPGQGASVARGKRFYPPLGNGHVGTARRQWNKRTLDTRTRGQNHWEEGRVHKGN